LYSEIDEQDHKSGALLDGDAEGSFANFKLRDEYLASIREEDELMSKTKLIQKKLTKSNTKSSLSGSPRKNNLKKKETINSISTDERLKHSISSQRISIDVARVEH